MKINWVKSGAFAMPMFLKTFAFFVLLFTSTAAWSDTQTIILKTADGSTTLDSEDLATTPIEVWYQPDPEAEASGVGFGIFFDSAVVQPTWQAEYTANFFLSGEELDGSNQDQLNATDKYVNISYASFTSKFDAGQSWPLKLGILSVAIENEGYEGQASLTALVTGPAAGFTAGEASTFTIEFPVTPPAITAPSDLTVEATSAEGIAASNSAVAAFLSGASATDAVDGDVTANITNDQSGMSSFELGVTTVTFSVTDSDGGTSTAQASITVVDTTNPVVSFGAETSTTLSGDAAGIPIANLATYFGNFSAVDSVSGVDVQITNNAPLVFATESTTIVTLTATDAAGNAAAIDVTVNVRDTEAPAFAATGPLTIEADLKGGLSYSESELLSALGITDNVASGNALSVTVSPAVAGLLPVGTISYTVTATDSAATPNATTKAVSVTVTDTTAPVITGSDLLGVEAISPDGVAASESVIVDWLAGLSVSDVVDDVVAVTNDAPSLFPVGDTTVTLTATDAAGNSAQKTLKVEVLANTVKPIVTPPANLTLEADSPNGALSSGSEGSKVPGFLASGSATDDLEGTVTVSSSFVDDAGNAITLDTMPLGASRARFSAVDAFGNEGEAFATVTVVDTTKPVITGPDLNALTIAAVDASGAPANTLTAEFLSDYTASDVVDTAVTLTNNAPSQFALGDTTVTLTATDDAGNVATLTATIKVTDQTAPNLAATAIDSEATSAAGAVVTETAILAAITSSDNVDQVVFPQLVNALPTSFALGSTDVQVQGEDNAGNSTTITAVVTIVDTTKPVITGEALQLLAETPSSVILSSDPVIMAWSDTIAASDIVDGAVTVTYQLPASFAVGTQDIVFTATDAAGNTAQATFSVVVLSDLVAPELLAPENVTVEAAGPTGVTAEDTAASEITAFLASAVATDDIDGEISGSITNDAVFPFKLGATTVTFSVADTYGNSDSDTATVTVVDTTKPVITGPVLNALTIAAVDAAGSPANSLTAEFLGSYTATDLVDTAVALTNNAPSQFPLGDTTVTLTATDDAGNTATLATTVTVTDQFGPSLTTSAVVIEATSGAGASVSESQILSAAVANDAVDGVLSVGLAQTLPASFALGTTLVLVSATDAVGNATSESVSVSIVDTTAPIISGADLAIQLATPDEVIVSSDARIAAWVTSVVANDIVDGVITPVVSLPAEFKLGEVAVTFSAVDLAGNTATNLALTITLLPDSVEPVVTPPAAITIEAAGPAGVGLADEAAAEITVFLAAVEASDDVDGDVSASVTNNASYPFALGTTSVTFEVADIYGNAASATASVTVVDTTGPVISGNLTGVFPADTSAGAASARADIAGFAEALVAIDAVDGAVGLSVTLPETFALGETDITASAVDATGNQSIVTLTFSVTDQAAPTLTTTGLSVEATSSDGAAVTEAVILAQVVATDNVDQVVLPALGAELPANFALGITQFPIAATDQSGNEAGAAVAIEVVDTTKPVITGEALQLLAETPSSVILSSDPVIMAWSDTIAASDIVDGAVTVTYQLPASFAVGTQDIVFTATDAAGNTAQATFSVVVLSDLVAPELLAPENVTVEAAGPTGVTAEDTAASEITAFLASAVATDDIDGEISGSITNDAVFPFKLGATTVTFSVADTYGNSDSDTATVTVVDTTKPVITGPVLNALTIAAVDAAGSPANSLTAEFLGSYTATDLVDTAVALTNNAPSQFPLGDTTVTLTATDDAGNTATLATTVTVTDQFGPSLTTSAVVIEATSGAGASVSESQILSAAVANDAVDGVLSVGLAQTLPASFALGTTLVLVSATDAVGNATSESVSVSIVDTTAPIISGADLAIQLATPDEVIVSSDARIAAWVTSVVANDIVDGVITPVVSLPAEFKLGEVAVTFSAVDLAGNTATNLALTITLLPDSVEPVVTPPAAITIEAAGPAGVGLADEAAAEITVFLAAVEASDDVDGDVSASVTNNASYPFALGTTSVTFEVADIYGNAASATASVTVVDTTGPVISGNLTGVFPADTSAGAASARADIAGFAEALVAIDAVDGAVGLSVTLPETFALGETDITASAVDATGNQSIVTLTFSVTDQAAPTLTTTGLSVEATSSDGAAVTEAVILAQVVATDNVDQVVLPALGAELPANFALGITQFPIAATDQSGNEAGAAVAIEVVDTTPPVITGDDLGIPSTDPNVLIESGDAQIQDWLDTITATDIVDGSVTLTFELPESFGTGTTEVTFSTVDAAGNEATAVFAVSLAEDEVPPVLTPPTPITIEAGSSVGVANTDDAAADVLAFLAAGLADDNFEGDISGQITNDLSFPVGLGETTVTFEISDRFGNSDSGTSTVTVVDTTPPKIGEVRSGTFSAADASGLPASDQTVQDFVASLVAQDAVDGELAVGLDLPEQLPIGITKVVGRAVDANGNNGAASFLLIVSDQTGPEITTVPLIVEAQSSAGALVSDAALLSVASASDNVDPNPILLAAAREQLVYPLGESSAVILATDSAKNESTGIVSIRVQDTTPPVFVNAVNLGIQLLQEGQVASSSAEVQDWLASVSAVDAVDGERAVTSSGVPETFEMGKTVVAFSTTDATGNAASIELTVSLFLGPKISVPQDITVVSFDGNGVGAENARIQSYFAGVSAVDTAGVVVEVTNDAPSSFDVGATVITFTATDAGNVTTTETGIIQVITASADSDLDGDGMDDLFEATFGLDPNSAGDKDLDADGDGLTNIEEYTLGKDPQVDDVPPELTAPDDVVVNSTGYKTKVNLGSALASDVKDGELEAVPSDAGPFLAGAHLVIWTATDGAGNMTIDEQFVSVNPRVSTTKKQRSAEGETVELEVVLNGRAAVYPLEVPFTLSGTAELGADYTLDQEVVTISEDGDGRVGRLIFSILSDDEDSEGNETILVTLQAPASGAVLGSGNIAEINIVEEQVPPALGLKASQGETQGRTVAQSGGRVVVDLSITDPNGTHTIDWSESDNNLVSLAPADANTFEFNPSNLTPGNYKIFARVTDSGITDQDFRVSLVVSVKEAEVIETDSDNDGIPDSQDTSTDDNVLAVDANSSQAAVTADEGVKLVIGSAASSQGTAGVAVDESTIASSGEDGGDAPTNGNDEDFDYEQGIYDFEVTELPIPGQSVNIVIPVGGPIPADAVYRKYTEATGWIDFIVDDNNAVASALGDDGACPDAGDASEEGYTQGLTAGHTCLQLTLEDGGPNDADGEINGIIDDPGGIATVAPVQVVEINAEGYSNRKSVGGGGCSVSTGSSDYGLVLLLLLGGLMFVRRRPRTRS